jgi:hypothetical protein
MPNRARHPHKVVEAALKAAEDAGLLVVPTRSGHRWGYIRCPRCKGRDLSVWSTPRVAENMASQILKFIARHRHSGKEARAK